MSNLDLDKLSRKMRRPDTEQWRKSRREILETGRRHYNEYNTEWRIGRAIRHTFLIPIRLLSLFAGLFLLFIAHLPQILLTLVVLGATWFVGVFIYAGFQ